MFIFRLIPLCKVWKHLFLQFDTDCLNKYGTYVSANNSNNIKVFFLVSDLKTVYNNND